MFGQRRTLFEHIIGLGPFVLPMIALPILLMGFQFLFFLIGLIGTWFIFESKRRSFAQKKFLTFGAKDMNPSERKKYFI